MLQFYIKRKKDEKIEPLSAPHSGSWVCAFSPTPEDISFLVKTLRIPRSFIEASLDPSEQPRIDVEQNKVLIILKVPFKHGRSVKTGTLGLIFTGRHVVTISSRLFPVFDEIIASRDFTTTQHTRFFLKIFSIVTQEFLRYLNDVHIETEEIEKKVEKALSNEEIKELLRVQKTLTYFRSATSGNSRVFEKILSGKILKLYEEDEDLLEDIVVDNSQAIEMINMYLEILSNTMDAYASIVGNNLNIIMKRLTVISLILTIPTAIASFYGMNVLLPLQHNPFAFWIILALSLLLSTFAYYFMKKRGWL